MISNYLLVENGIYTENLKHPTKELSLVAEKIRSISGMVKTT